MERYAITISRRFGSGGRQIASELADDLGIHSYENRILTLAARYSGRDEHDFVEVDEKLRGGYFSSQIHKLQKRFTPQPHAEQFESDDRLFEFQAYIIRELVGAENCIVVGKCADYILKDHHQVLRVHIGAPTEYCVERTMKHLNVNQEEAEQMVRRTDRYRKDYYKYYTNGRQWMDLGNYDLMLNNAELGDRASIYLIKEALKRKLKLPL